MNLPKHLKYTKEHEWAALDGSQAAIGITDHAQSALGDIVFIELPKVGRKLKAGEVFGVVESIKAVSELYSPVDGEVVAINEGLTMEPGSINRDPYASWMIKVALASGASQPALLDVATYEKLLS